MRPERQHPRPREDRVSLPGGVSIAVRWWTTTATPATPPFLLVHGLASNARMWDAAAAELAAAGHEVVAVDLRAHGRSPDTADGHDTATAAADLAELIDALGLEPSVAAGQSWGGNVVLELAAAHGRVAAVALVDGGWTRLADRYPDFASCWAALAPPALEREAPGEVERRLRERARAWPAASVDGLVANLVRQPDGTVRNRLPRSAHRQILRSLYEAEPASRYPHVHVPAALLVAAPAAVNGSAPALPRAVEEARDALADAVVVAYPGAGHDLHAAQPQRTAADLRALAARADRTSHKGVDAGAVGR